jgi:hypothetical protein
MTVATSRDLASGRLGASALDEILSPAEQQGWLASAASDAFGDDVREDNAQVRRANRVRFDRLAADFRLAAVLPAVRRYLAFTMPAPRRTEFSRWSVSASPDTNKNSYPRLMTVTVHSLETLYVHAPVDQQHRTIFSLNVDRATMLRHWPNPAEAFEAAFVDDRGYAVRPGVLRLEVEGARNFLRLLEVDGVVEAARRLNLDMMRKGPCLQWKSHSFGLADLLFGTTGEPGTDGDDNYGLLRSAERARDEGDLAVAGGLYQRAALRGSAEAYAQLGFILHDMGDTAYAETAYRNAADAGHGLGWYGLAALRLEAGDTEKAESLYRKAADAGHAGALLDIGALQWQRGEKDLAEANFRIAAKARFPDAEAALGEVAADRGDRAAAVRHFDRAIKWGSTSALIGLGLLLENEGDLTGAEHRYQQASEAGDTNGLINLAMLCAFQHEDDERAEAYCRAAAEAGYPDPYAALGDLLHDEGLAEAAERYYHLAEAALSSETGEAV